MFSFIAFFTCSSVVPTFAFQMLGHDKSRLLQLKTPNNSPKKRLFTDVGLLRSANSNKPKGGTRRIAHLLFRSFLQNFDEFFNGFFVT